MSGCRTDGELDAIVAMLTEAGFVKQVADEGKPSLRLTVEGQRVAQQMALSSEDDGQASRGWSWRPRIMRPRHGDDERSGLHVAMLPR